VYHEYSNVAEVADAIRSMVIRGAPAIGCAAALGLAQAAHQAVPQGRAAVTQALAEAATLLASTRPTAVNLFWAIERIKELAEAQKDVDAGELAQAVLDEAQAIINADAEANKRMGRYGAELLPSPVRILTHCNTGALATGGYGTALGIIRAAAESGKQVLVFANETRPLLQGARLTAWELQRDGIDVTVIPDSLSGFLMQQGLIDCAVVGADRIAANGDVANKVGTYNVAVLCHHHGLPFYVAAPTSTIDRNTARGQDIPIEERPPGEVTTIGGQCFVPPAVPVRNLAFDVTPAALVTAIITEQGVLRAPYADSIGSLAACPPVQ
jgi:methylthioribose-1-phosphate isomerase